MSQFRKPRSNLRVVDVRPSAGRIPPQDLDAEATCLSAALLDPAARDVVLSVLRPEHMYSDSNRMILEAISAVQVEGHGVDACSVASWLRSRELLSQAGGTPYLALVTDCTPSVLPQHVEGYCLVVLAKARLRSAIALHQRLAAEGYGDVGDPDQWLDDGEAAVFALRSTETQDATSLGVAITEAITTSMARVQGQRVGVTTGLRSLDKVIMGLHSSQLIVVAGRPGMGKSALAVGIALAAAEEGHGVAVFSLEMSRQELAPRLLAAKAQVGLRAVTAGTLSTVEWRDVTESAAALAKLPLWIDDSAGQTLESIRAKSRRMAAQMQRDGHPLGLVVVDYLQLMEGQGKSREEAVSSCSRGLKQLAKELGVPVLVLSQLNRGVESRSNKRPQLSDLRECIVGSSIVTDARTGKRSRVDDLGPHRTFGCADGLKLVAADATAPWSTGKQAVFAVTTATGRELRCTIGHRFMTIHGWRTLSEIKVGTEVAVPMVIPPPEEPIDGISIDEARLLGYLISDGSYIKRRSVSYTKRDPAVLNDVKRIALERFGLRPVGDATDFDLTNSHCGPNGNPLICWLRDLGIHGQRSNEKRVPEALFSCRNEVVAHFVSTLLAGDGSVVPRKSGWCVKFTSTSRELLHDLQHLLLRLGVLSVIGKQEWNSKSTMPIATLSVRNHSDIVALSRAVSIPGIKGEKLRQAAATTLQRENAHIDRLPLEVLDDIGCIKESTGLNWRELGYRCQGKRPSRASVARVCDVAAILGVESKRLRALAESDVLWDRIASVVPDGEDETYDIEVPSVGSYVVNDIVTHNSGAIEQDADVVILLYRSGYYAEQDNKVDESGGECEAIVAKQRNGPTGTCKLRWWGASTRFTDVEEEGR